MPQLYNQLPLHSESDKHILIRPKQHKNQIWQAHAHKNETT